MTMNNPFKKKYSQYFRDTSIALETSFKCEKIITSTKTMAGICAVLSSLVLELEQEISLLKERKPND